MFFEKVVGNIPAKYKGMKIGFDKRKKQKGSSPVYGELPGLWKEDTCLESDGCLKARFPDKAVI